MNKANLKSIREFLGESQRVFSGDLGVSLKALQSYEQGGRRIPGDVEKRVLFYLSILNRKHNCRTRHCWQIRRCDASVRHRCFAWKLGAGRECWYISGNMCRSVRMRDWREKRDLCLRCDAFLQHLRFLKPTPLYNAIVGRAHRAATEGHPGGEHGRNH